MLLCCADGLQGQSLLGAEDQDWVRGHLPENRCVSCPDQPRSPYETQWRGQGQSLQHTEGRTDQRHLWSRQAWLGPGVHHYWPPASWTWRWGFQKDQSLLGPWTCRQTRLHFLPYDKHEDGMSLETHFDISLNSWHIVSFCQHPVHTMVWLSCLLKIIVMICLMCFCRRHHLVTASTWCWSCSGQPLCMGGCSKPGQ